MFILQACLHKLFLSGDVTVPVANCENVQYDAQPKEDMTLRDYLDYWQKHIKQNYESEKGCLYMKDMHFTRYTIYLQSITKLVKAVSQPQGLYPARLITFLKKSHPTIKPGHEKPKYFIHSQPQSTLHGDCNCLIMIMSGQVGSLQRGYILCTPDPGLMNNLQCTMFDQMKSNNKWIVSG